MNLRLRRDWIIPPAPVRVQVASFARSRLGRNVVANYVGTVIAAAMPLLVLPFLVKALGPTMWGLVSFSTFLVSTLAVLNSGLSQSMIREFGSRWMEGEAGRQATARLLFSYERIYWAAAFLITVCVLPFAGLIVARGLHVGAIDPKIAVHAIQCSVILFFLSLPSAIYRTVLSALQGQVILNVVQITSTLLKSFGGVLVASMTGSVLAYLVFQVMIVFFETLTLSIIAWRTMPTRRSAQYWDWPQVRSTLRFSAIMSAIVTLGVLTTLVDKFFVSAKLPIEQLGIYSIASGLGLGTLQIGYPIFNAVLPRLVELGSDHRSRAQANLKLAAVIVPMIGCAALGYFLLGDPLLHFWLKNDALAAQVKPILTLILASSALNTIYNVGYINWVSTARTGWIVSINVTSLAVAIIVTPRTIDAFGLKGAAAAHLIMNSIGAVCALFWIVRFALVSRSLASRIP